MEKLEPLEQITTGNAWVNAKIGLEFDQLIGCFKLRFTFDDNTKDILIIPSVIAEMWQKRHNLVISFHGKPLDTAPMPDKKD